MDVNIMFASQSSSSSSSSSIPHHHHHHPIIQFHHHHHQLIFCPQQCRRHHHHHHYPIIQFHHHHHHLIFCPQQCRRHHHHHHHLNSELVGATPLQSLEVEAAPLKATADHDTQMLQEQEHNSFEEGGEDDDEPIFVMTDEWREFFAKSEAKRKLEKQQKQAKRK